MFFIFTDSKSEWIDFSSKWPKIENIANVEVDLITEKSESDDDIYTEYEELEERERTENTTQKRNEKNINKPKESCRNCILCASDVLQKCRLHLSTYSNLHMAYKYPLTLSCTQVRCEVGSSHKNTFKFDWDVVWAKKNCMYSNLCVLKKKHFEYCW